MNNLARTVAFLRSIGFTLIEDPTATGFVRAILIEKGQLRYDPTHATPSNLLHEAGHLAVIPARYRQKAGDNLDALFEQMGADVGKRIEEDPELDLDSDEMRGVIQAGETEATAWAFAAGRAIGLPDEVTIEDHDYQGEGAEVRLGLACNAYLGINGLVAGRMCQSVRTYPTLTRWFQV